MCKQNIVWLPTAMDSITKKIENKVWKYPKYDCQKKSLPPSPVEDTR